VGDYPWVFLAYGVGGIVGPILGGWMGDAATAEMIVLRRRREPSDRT
jgi:predicted MFS family arabinose efflux permease